MNNRSIRQCCIHFIFNNNETTIMCLCYIIQNLIWLRRKSFWFHISHYDQRDQQSDDLMHISLFVYDLNRSISKQWNCLYISFNSSNFWYLWRLIKNNLSTTSCITRYAMRSLLITKFLYTWSLKKRSNAQTSIFIFMRCTRLFTSSDEFASSFHTYVDFFFFENNIRKTIKISLRHEIVMLRFDFYQFSKIDFLKFLLSLW